jgi:hypothetical protein
MGKYPINENEMEEIQGIAEQIIEKSYKDWMTKEKN